MGKEIISLGFENTQRIQILSKMTMLLMHTVTQMNMEFKDGGKIKLI